MLADSAYGTGDALAALDGRRAPPVVKPWPLRPAVAGRVHPRRLRPRRRGRHRDLPERDHPHDHRGPERRPSASPAAAARCATRCTTANDGRNLILGHAPRPATRPPRTRRAPSTSRRLPAAPAHGRTLHRLAHPRQPPRPLPRRRPRTTPGSTPASPPQPAPAAQPRPHAPTTEPGTGLTAGPTTPRSPPRRACERAIAGTASSLSHPGALTKHAATTPIEPLPAATAQATPQHQAFFSRLLEMVSGTGGMVLFRDQAVLWASAR